MNRSINRLIRHADYFGRRVDVRCGERILQMSTTLEPQADDVVFDAQGGALMPGLHDHHIHLLATAAAAESVFCGPPAVCDVDQLKQTLTNAPGDGWLRGVGYHESVAGPLDRRALDAICMTRPVRLQHRSGKAWLLNSLACEQLSVEDHLHLSGVERAPDGTASGRLFRMDRWLREQMANVTMPDLKGLSARLSACGVTGVTDASVSNTDGSRAQHQDVRQQIYWMGGEDLSGGHRKIILDEDALPGLDVLANTIAQAHERDRPVAIHCVAHIELLLALTALQQAGRHPNDRIEHGAVVQPDMLAMLRDAGVAVVTQPGFIWQRGDQYQRDVEPAQWQNLYRYKSLLELGIRVCASSDGPYGPIDPWQVMSAAVQRRTREGVLLGECESVSPDEALSGYLSDPLDPGGPPRSLAPGGDATFIVLDQPWHRAQQQLDQVKVRLTLQSGRLAYMS